MATKKVRVTVFGFSQEHTGKRKISIGESVLLKRDPDNPKDKDAIKVLTSNGMEQVGWVANSPHMVKDGTQSAGTVNGLFSDTCLGRVESQTKVQYNNGRKSDAFIVELILREETQKGANDMNNKVQNLKVKIAGSKSQYPVKWEQVVPEFKAGKAPYVKLYVEGDEIKAEYNGQPCGFVEKKNEPGLSPYDDVLSSIGEQKFAKVTGVKGISFFVEFTVDEKELAEQKTKMTLSGIIQTIVDNGINTQEQIDEKIEYLKACGVTNKQILGLLKTYIKYDDEVAKLIPLKPKTLYQDSTGIIRRSVAYTNMKRNLMLEGDRGVGKNVMITTLAWLYSRPLYEFSLNSQHDNQALLGSKTIDVDEKGNNVMGFDPEVVVQAGEYGGILVLDEINTSVGHVMSVLNSYLDDRRRLSVPGYKTIFAHENFTAIGTMNKDYQSTFEMNEATSDRFVPIVFPKSKSIMDTLLAKVPEASFDDATKSNLLYQGILKCVEDGTIGERSLTIRGFIDSLLGTLMDIPLKEALLDNVANRCSDLDDRKSIKNMIEDILG